METTMLSVLRWTARVTSVLSVGMLLLFLTEGFDPARITPQEWLGLLFFPVGIIAGMAWGWRDPLQGGVVTVLSLAAFYGLMLVTRGEVPRPLAFLLFTLPGLLFLVLGLLQRTRGAALGPPVGT
jgi:hypothetical protein